MSNERTEFQRLWSKIGNSGVMVLSTCADNRVTSRAMSVVVIDGKFYCQTDERYLKCRQIKANPNVSLFFKDYSIEGSARISGRPTDSELFVTAMKKHFKLAYMRYSALETECVIEITPKLVSHWKYELNKPYIERWNFENSSYSKEIQE